MTGRRAIVQMTGFQIWAEGFAMAYPWLAWVLHDPVLMVSIVFFGFGMLWFIGTDVKRHGPGIFKFLLAIAVLIFGKNTRDRIKALEEAHNEEMEELQKKIDGATLTKKFKRPKNWLDL